MKAARFYGKEDIRVEDIAEPEPGPGQVKIKVAWCGICGSDLHEYIKGPMTCPKTPHPHTKEQVPITLGHEFSGTIVSVGEGVDESKYPLGQNVVVEPVVHCPNPECSLCTTGLPNLCMPLTCIGLTGGGGGLSEYITVGTRYVHAVPDSVPLEIAACVEPLAVAWYAVQRSNFRPENTCLIIGSGPIGLFVLKVLKSLGCSFIAVSEPARGRREKARQLGADLVIDPLSTNAAEEIQKHTDGKGVDIAYECAGSEPGLNTAIAALKPRGLVMNVSLWEERPGIDMGRLLMGEKVLTASCCYTNIHPDVIEALATGKIKGVEELITRKISIHNVVGEGFEALIKDKENQIKILVHPGEPAKL